MVNDSNLMIKAAQLRKKLGAVAESPIDIFSIIQNIPCLTLVFHPLGEHLSGMCIKGRQDRCLIAVNSLMSIGRLRFSIAHELFHIYYDSNLKAICSQDISLNSGKEIEKQADCFASFFLMPPAEFDSMTEKLASINTNGKLTLEDIIRIEQYFGTSHKATMVRLKGSRFLQHTQFDEFFNNPNIKFIAESMGFSSFLYSPLPENRRHGTFGHYVRQAEKLLKNGTISNGKYEELMLSAFRPDLVYGSEESTYVID
ncbi:MAG: ImmA/IrrE family metallo-endopeptidase [Victivallales bacterium]|nr:ImmA/IrrE family metallo-endopeptidase [Victivallales bacterium]